MKKLLVAIIVFIQTVQIYANEDWFKIGGNDEANFYINMRSISEFKLYGKPVVKAWIKREIYNDISKDGLSVGDYNMVMYYSNCEEKTLGVKSLTDYKKGKVFGASNNYSYVEMKDVIPDSIGEAILAYSCTGNEIKKNGT